MSLTTLLLLTGFLFFLAVALTALILATRSADEGYEDEAGFHAGRRKTARVRTPRLVKPLLHEQFKIMLMPDVPVSALILAPGASPQPPRMDPVRTEAAGAMAALMPADIPLSSLGVQLASAGAATEPKRKRKSSRKDGSSDTNQLGFPGFAA